MRRLDAALVGAEQPALHKRCDAVHGGEQLVRLLARRPDRLGPVLVILAAGRAVARKPIGDHHRAGFHVGEHELPQCGAGDIGDHLQPTAAKPTADLLDSHLDHHLPLSAAPAYARLGTAEKRLVGLHDPAQPLAARAHHRRAVAVQHRPCRLLRADPQRPLEPKR